ncbi:hypothetical protein [Streptomyces oceani]|uniref:YtxH domain-containing protein n=1 Tax=Streptomyces oceani TaxID=1075402 RepID=A0A1E7KFD3_9ACTN|nr:hypothetical protein [Streptomyces oceani]OEV02628.1 hypothetical protein AN216_14015 [Streptomyces oceani]
MHRLTFIAGLAIGYVLGTRSGRERYEQLRSSAQQMARNPAVRNVAESAAHNGMGMATKAFDQVNERVGHRLPESVSERVQAMREHRMHADDQWATERENGWRGSSTTR